MPTFVGNGTPMRAPPTPPPTRTPPTSPSTRASSSPTSATSASWLRMARKRRYNLEPPPNIQHLVMRVALVKMKMIYLLFLPTSAWNKKEKLNELIEAIHEKDELLDSCDRTSQVIRPTYSCPYPTDLRQPCRCT
jgi:hypothetical protein